MRLPWVSDPTILAKTASYIIGKEKTYEGLIVILEIISPTGLIGIGSNGINYKKIPPITYRSALTKLITPNGEKVLSRLVGINSYYFHILIPKSFLTPKEMNVIKNEALGTLTGAESLNDKKKVELKMCHRDGLSTMMPRLLNHFQDYKNFFNKKKRKSANK